MTTNMMGLSDPKFNGSSREGQFVALQLSLRGQAGDQKETGSRPMAATRIKIAQMEELSSVSFVRIGA